MLMRTRSVDCARRPTAHVALVTGLIALAAPLALADGAELDLKKIVLYRSGVGFFERQGSIQGDQTVALRFQTDQINDILKSMVVLDLDPGVGGTLSGITYGSEDPLDRRLSAFRIDVSEMPSVAELFTQVQGAKVKLHTSTGAVEGSILSVESRPVVTPSSAGYPAVTNEKFVNLLTSAGMQSIRIATIASFDFADEGLRADLASALEAMSEHRDALHKSVELAFTGPQDRAHRVIVSYIHESPVWKTSYRLVLPQSDGDQPILQGWAIVENTTDSDWNDVRLSLASGRPVSFTMDLYAPLYLRRPNVPVPVLAGVGPRTYADSGSVFEQDDLASVPAVGSYSMGRLENQEKGARARSVMGGLVADSFGDASAPAESNLAYALAQNAPGAQASAGEVGEQFMYTLDMPVTIARRQSAMLPIINVPVSGRRVSIYNAADSAKHPMRGAELTNDTDMHLMPGPISVYDADAYAGDAQIPNTSRNQTRLLAYAVDLDVQATTERKTQSDTVHIRIVDGLIEQTLKNRQTTTYKFASNDSNRDRTILVEHPRMPGWDLVEPKKPDDTTDALYRFEVDLGPSGKASLNVVQERVAYQRIGVTSYSLETLLVHARNGRVSQPVVDAVRHVAELQWKINDLERTIAVLDTERNTISRDQDRIRNNMGRIDRNSQLYGRYMAKLNTQEDRLEAIQTQRDTAQQRHDALQKELNDYLGDLDVE